MTNASLTLSFDDAPTPDASFYDGKTRTEKLVASLKAGMVDEVVFYCNTTERDLSRLAQYAAAGHVIANHTSSHPDLQKVDAEAFKRSVAEAEKALEKVPGCQKWFRFPYLREAHKDLSKNQEIKKFLLASGYRFGFITIETYDWYLDSLFQAAFLEGKDINFERLEALYFQMLFETIEEGMKSAQTILGRQPVHVLLLHENDLNALMIGKFAIEARQRGFHFPKASEAFQDPIADPKWNGELKTMRRLHQIAEHKKMPEPAPLSWLQEAKIKKAFEAVLEV